MKRVAFVTQIAQPNLNDSDALVVPLLANKGVVVEAKPWDDTSVEWRAYDAVVLRSAWNYHLHTLQFQAWLARLEAIGIRVWNTPAVIGRNTNKLYLFELETLGVQIVPSVLCHILSGEIIRRVRMWDMIVIKPAVGATSYRVKKFSSSAFLFWIPYVWLLLRSGPVIIQKFIKSVEHGEYSLIFFDKKFSHAVKKVPKIGDFRSQEVFGGTDIPVKLSNESIKQAKSILDHISEELLYARVDGLVIDGKFYLMELELTEPYLFLKSDSRAALRLADAIHSCLNRYTKL